MKEWLTKNWRKDLSDDQKQQIDYGLWDFEEEDWQPMVDKTYKTHWLRILDVKEYDPIILDKNMKTQRAYDYFEGDLDAVAKSEIRNERLSPELNFNDVPMIDDKFMLIQDKTYRIYFNYIFKLLRSHGTSFGITPTAKALNYGFMFQSPIVLQQNYNPVIPFYDNELGYIISTNMHTPVTVNIPKGTILGILSINP